MKDSHWRRRSIENFVWRRFSPECWWSQLGEWRPRCHLQLHWTSPVTRPVYRRMSSSEISTDEAVNRLLHSLDWSIVLRTVANKDSDDKIDCAFNEAHEWDQRGGNILLASRHMTSSYGWETKHVFSVLSLLLRVFLSHSLTHYCKSCYSSSKNF